MKTFCVTTTLLTLLLSGSFGFLNAQNVREKACLDRTEQFILKSDYVKGENFRIQVSLPLDYSASTKAYPVYYFTDGDVAFGMTKGIADLLMIGKEMKNIIVVGIGYGQGLLSWNIKRIRDLTPTRDTSLIKGLISGGADNFLKFIQYELFPVINKNYRTYPDSASVGGHSLGGLLNSYILFKQPELFRNYIIGSPSLIWDKKYISKLENEYFSRHKELNCNVYIYYASMDSKDEIINPANELIQSIKIHNYKGINLITRIYEGETHMSVPAVAITYGLRALFKP
jgi:predicted alpha/beta superfamily hydrolase